ncbi:hypothetical protein BC938DRAFT_477169 [Jimgerdemannia flammicorona]|uniref:Uncharacterized protein n=1 Tax=Jimgerdemannia flammicorona TaxID=994334 RepID=A0A433PBI1_9FUNG|nr:hypothetical protein BC938DRAFT_477169 [Jimgerdemannia flammicorona]
MSSSTRVSARVPSRSPPRTTSMTTRSVSVTSPNLSTFSTMMAR